MPIVNCCERVLADSSAGSVVAGNRRTGSRRTDPRTGCHVASPIHTTHRTDLPCRQSSNSPQLLFVSYSFARPQPTFNFAFFPPEDPPLCALVHPSLCDRVGPTQRYAPISDLSFPPFTSNMFCSRPHSRYLFEGTQVVQGPSRRKSPRVHVLVLAHPHVCG
jgi:hypothetical protein